MVKNEMTINNTSELRGFTEIRMKDGAWFSIDLSETYSDIYVKARSEDDYRDTEVYEIWVKDIVEAI